MVPAEKCSLAPSAPCPTMSDSPYSRSTYPKPRFSLSLRGAQGHLERRLSASNDAGLTAALELCDFHFGIIDDVTPAGRENVATLSAFMNGRPHARGQGGETTRIRDEVGKLRLERYGASDAVDCEVPHPPVYNLLVSNIIDTKVLRGLPWSPY